MSWNILPKVNLQYFLQKIKEKFYTKTESDARYSQTDDKVTQTNTGTNAYYRVLLSGTNDNTTRTEGARKSGNILFNPSTSLLQIRATGSTSSETPDTEILSQVVFTNYNTDNDTSYSAQSTIRAYHDHQKTSTAGNNLVINSGAGLFIGSGEGASNHYSAVGKANTAENTFITSDSNVHIQANGQTIADRKGMQVTSNGNVVPEVADVSTDNSGGIGTANSRWANGYFVNINGAEVGNSPKFTDEKVKQTAMGTDAKEYRVLLTTTDTNTEETNTVRKCSALRFQPSDGALKLAKVHTQTSNANQVFEIGNNIPNGTAGNDTGVLRLYGKSQYYGQFADSNNALTTNRTYYLPNKSGTLALVDDAEKVKQTPTGSENKGYRMLVSCTNDDNEETNIVRKALSFTHNPSSGYTQIARKHTGTTAVSTPVDIGNNVADGMAGATYGDLRIYGRSEYYGRFWDRYGALTANRHYILPDNSGNIALKDDVSKAWLKQPNWNLISFPCYTSDGTGSGITFTQGNEIITFTGTATAQITYYVKRYTQEWTLPAGKYRLSGCPSGGSSTTYRLRVGADTSTSTTTWLGYDTGNGFEFTLTEEKIITVTFNIYNGHAIQDSLIVRPTLIQLNGGWIDLGNNTTDIPDIFSEYKFVLSFTDTDDSTVPVTNAVFDLPRVLLKSGETYSAIAGSMGNPNANIYCVIITNIIGGYNNFGYTLSVSLLRGNHAFTLTSNLYAKV